MEYLIGYILVSVIVTPIIAACCGMNELDNDAHPDNAYPDLPYPFDKLDSK